MDILGGTSFRKKSPRRQFGETLEILREIEFIDTHAHLSDERFDVDRAEVLARAQALGITRLIEIADGPQEWAQALSLARARSRFVRAALGLHPYHADQFSEGLFEDLSKKALLPEVVGIGEIGLDYAKSSVPAEIQKPVFERLLFLAKSLKKPCVIHCREAYLDLIPIIEKVFPHPPDSGFWGVVHCFSGGNSEALFLKEKGFLLGVDGPVTYPKNNALREALRLAGLDRLVLETDSPYLPPQSSRGKRNEPSSIPEIAAKLSEVFGVSLAEVADKTTRNAVLLFPPINEPGFVK